MYTNCHFLLRCKLGVTYTCPCNSPGFSRTVTSSGGPFMLNPAHVPFYVENSHTLGITYNTRKRRADIVGMIGFRLACTILGPRKGPPPSEGEEFIRWTISSRNHGVITC